MRRLSRFPSIIGWVSLLGGFIAASLLWPLTTPVAAAQNDSLPKRVAVNRSAPLRVLLVGDSLTNASRDFFTAAVTANDTAVVDSTMVRGGSAICDWLPFLSSKLREFTPAVAVIEFSGNRLTPCMKDAATGTGLTGDAWLQKYRSDAEAAMSIFEAHGVGVLWVGVPRTREDTGAQATLNNMYRRLAARSLAAYVNAGAVVLDEGKYTDYLPCEADEPCTETHPSSGQPAARVRAPDGGHFCPNAVPVFMGTAEPCSVWSSGAWRFGAAMAAPIISAYGL